MNLTEDMRNVLETYHAGGGKLTVEDVARECEMSVSAASEHAADLVTLGLLTGARNRKITENGIAVLEGRELPPEALAAPPVEPLGPDADSTEKPSLPQKQNTARKMTDLLADKLHCDPAQLFELVRCNVIQVERDGQPPTNAEVFHVLNVMHQYDLNPWMRQVHAFRHRGRLCVMLGHDGWVKKALEFPGYRGAIYKYSPTMVETSDRKGRKCWEWVECTVASAGRLPTTVRVFLDEWYVEQGNKRDPGPWQKYTRHRLRQKAFDQAVREHCGIALYDESDREQMKFHDMGVAEIVEEKTAELTGEIKQQLAAASGDAAAMQDLGVIDVASVMDQEKIDELVGGGFTKLDEEPRAGSLDQPLFADEAPQGDEGLEY